MYTYHAHAAQVGNVPNSGLVRLLDGVSCWGMPQIVPGLSVLAHVSC